MDDEVLVAKVYERNSDFDQYSRLAIRLNIFRFSAIN